MNQAKDAPVIVWDLLEARQVFNLFGIREGVTALAFSPDERFLAACGQDGTMFVWDMQVGGLGAMSAQPLHHGKCVCVCVFFLCTDRRKYHPQEIHTRPYLC